MYELVLFSGIGGGILASKMVGITTVCAVEIEEYPRGVLMQRQTDGILPAFPIWDDVKTFRSDNAECSDFIKDLKQVRDNLIISGGFPCQDISSAGKGAGINGENSGLWREFARVVCEIRPSIVFVENSPLLTSRGLGTILKDFSEMGYNVIWGVLGASDIGAKHKRKRIWLLAYPQRNEQPREKPCSREDRRMGREWQPVQEKKNGETLIGKKRSSELEELMMGWPLGWSSLTPLEMVKYQQWQQQFSLY